MRKTDGKSKEADKREEQRRYQNQKISGHNHFTTLFTGFLLIAVCCICFGSFMASAHGNHMNPEQFQIYESITIKSGDTLWDIAESYMPNDYNGSIDSYIKELKSINRLSNDTIKTGDKLIVVYGNSF